MNKGEKNIVLEICMFCGDGTKEKILLVRI